MPANEGGYEVPKDIADEIEKKTMAAWPVWRVGGMTLEQEKKLDDLIAQVQRLTATVNQQHALILQLILAQQGIKIDLIPTDQTETSGIISANGVTL